MKEKENIIRSFEEGAEVSGDLLTGGKKHKNVRVGLLTCGYFEYWRMYPAMRAKVEGDLAAVEKNMRALCKDLVCTGMVDTLDRADAAGKKLREECVDAVVLVCGTYIPDFISLTALDYVREKPLIIFSTQAHANVGKSGNYEESLRNSGIIGIAQLTGTLRKMKRDYEIVVGCVEDARAYAKIGARLRALQAVEDLREANIGLIGHVFRGMYDIELSKTFFKSAFGVNVISIQSGHLLEEWKKVTDEEVEREKAQLLSRFKVKNTTEKDIFNSLKLYLAMRRISEKFNLDAMCFLDQHFVQVQVHTSARMGASLLMERTGMCVNCEGDLGGLVTMMLMKSITGKNPLMGEWGEYDTDTNSCLIIGHGIATPDLAVSDKDVLLARTPEEWGFDGNGLNYELVVKPSEATVAHIMESPEGYRMLVSEGETIPFPHLDYDEMHALFKVQTPVCEYLEKVFDYGVSHHCILSLGKIGEELRLAAKYLGIQSKTFS